MSSSKWGGCQPFIWRRQPILQAWKVQGIGTFKCINPDVPTSYLQIPFLTNQSPDLETADPPRLSVQSPRELCSPRYQLLGRSSAFSAFWLQELGIPFHAAKKASDFHTYLVICVTTVSLSFFKASIAPCNTHPNQLSF